MHYIRNTLKIFIIHMYGCFAGMYVCAPHTCLVPTEVLDPLVLGLQTVGSFHVVAGRRVSALHL